MKPHFIVLIALSLLNTKISAQQKHVESNKDKMADLVLDKVSEVPEVKEFLRSGKHSERKHVLMIDSEPHTSFKYYEVKMGYDGDMFITLERFCVNPKTLKVYYWDVMADDAGFSNSAIISLTQWRKLRETALWNKPHTYNSGKLVALAN